MRYKAAFFIFLFLFLFLASNNAYAAFTNIGTLQKTGTETKGGVVSIIITLPSNIVEKVKTKKVVKFKAGADLAKSVSIVTPSGKVIVREIKRKSN